ncbi:MAG TPA: dTMP kinase [Patescibacteria group bacterium]|nr:dTMP kinase [Patescibacteria group bacterium]
MSSRGKLLAVEGIDGAGKHTQVELLARDLDRRGIDSIHVSFPRYQSFFGRSVAQYLTGAFGQLNQVDPHFSALLYAGDRLEAKRELESALAAGRDVLADRYIGSNLAHQGARVGQARREEFLNWVRQLEYEIFGLPREDLVIYLRIPVEVAAERMASRAQKLSRDIQEGDRRHLEEAAAVYDSLAKSEGWAVVEGFDPGAKHPRPAGEIHQEIVALWESRLGVDKRATAPKRPGGEPGEANRR